MPFAWHRLKADALAMSTMNSALDAKLSTLGFKIPRIGVLSETSENAQEE